MNLGGAGVRFVSVSRRVNVRQLNRPGFRGGQLF